MPDKKKKKKLDKRLHISNKAVFVKHYISKIAPQDVMNFAARSVEFTVIL